MKTAYSLEGAELLRAEQAAPSRGLCPGCGGVVILRRRSGGTKGAPDVYFWRHVDNTNLDCEERSQNGRHVALAVLLLEQGAAPDLVDAG